MAHTEGATEKRNSSFAVVASRTKTCLAPLYPLFSFFFMLAIDVEDEILKYDKFNSTFFPLFFVVLLFYRLCFHMLQIGFWTSSRKKKSIRLSTSNGAPQPDSWVRKEKVHTELKKKKTRKMINTGIPTQKGVLNAPPPKKRLFSAKRYYTRIKKEMKDRKKHLLHWYTLPKKKAEEIQERPCASMQTHRSSSISSESVLKEEAQI